MSMINKIRLILVPKDDLMSGVIFIEKILVESEV